MSAAVHGLYVGLALGACVLIVAAAAYLAAVLVTVLVRDLIHRIRWATRTRR